MGRYGEIWGDMGRDGERWGEMGRQTCRETMDESVFGHMKRMFCVSSTLRSTHTCLIINQLIT